MRSVPTVRDHLATRLQLAASLVTAVAILSTPAYADDAVVEQSSQHVMGLGDVRGKAGDWLIMPAGVYTVGGGLGFMTADGGIGADGGEVKFTDVVLFSLSGRYSIAGSAELAASTTLLPKQPSFTDELVWQSSQISTRVGFARRFAATVHAAGGPLMDRAGYWLTYDLGIEARKSIHETLVFQGVLAGAQTFLFHDAATEQLFWFGEVALDGEMIFRAPNGVFAAWFGTEFRFPLAKNPTSGTPDPPSGMFLDPQTRVNVHLGMVLAYIENWDLFVQYSVIDRGDLQAPATRLPILDSGFDQHQLFIGLSRRFRSSPGNSDPKLFMAW